MQHNEIIAKLAPHLRGLKIEWESEGASLFDVIDLIRLSERHSIPLFLKIGGYEAIRDLIDLRSLGINNIIIPMVESVFGVKKALEAVDNIFNNEKTSITLTIESISGILNLSEIISAYKVRIDRVTIGRTDLGRSLDQAEKIDLPKYIERVITLCQAANIDTGLGGGITSKIFEELKPPVNLKYIETRHCIFETDFLRKSVDSIEQALSFEEAWLHHRLARQKIQEEQYQSRLNMLKLRK